MNHKCGHPINPTHLGRGAARLRRIADLAAILCPACKTQRLIELSFQLTDSRGRKVTEEQRLQFLERQGVIL